MLREEQAWPHKSRTTCSWMSKVSFPSSRDQLLAFASKDPATNYLVLQALLVNSATAPGEVTKGETFSSNKKQGRTKGRRCEKWDNKCFWPIAGCPSIAAFHIPGNYMGFQGNTTKTPGSTGEKQQISSAVLRRLLAAAAAKLTIYLIRITMIKKIEEAEKAFRVGLQSRQEKHKDTHICITSEWTNVIAKSPKTSWNLRGSEMEKDSSDLRNLRTKLWLYYNQVPDAKHLGAGGRGCIQFNLHSKQIWAI